MHGHTAAWVTSGVTRGAVYARVLRRMAEAGKVVGVGIVFDESSLDRLRVESLVPGSGAARCGEILPGDVLLTVDGIDVAGRKVSDLAPMFAGPAGSTVILTLMRGEENGIPTGADKLDVSDEVGAFPETVCRTSHPDGRPACLGRGAAMQCHAELR